MGSFPITADCWDATPRSANRAWVLIRSKRRSLEVQIDERERQAWSTKLGIECLACSSFYATWQLRKLRPGRKCGPCVTR